jgi:hypothetical protein
MKSLCEYEICPSAGSENDQLVEILRLLLQCFSHLRLRLGFPDPLYFKPIPISEIQALSLPERQVDCFGI